MLAADGARRAIRVSPHDHAPRSPRPRVVVTWQIARDADGALVGAVGALAMPTTLLLDEHGNILERHTGAISPDQLRDLIADRLGIAAGGAGG
jgi:hypothetical protein